VKRELERVEIPGEYDARRRTWEIVRGAYLEREPVPWPRRHVRTFALAAAAVAVVAAAVVTPPGRSVVDSLRRAIGVEHAASELVRLPAAGRLLLDSSEGTWIVQRDGSRRLLGPYHDASWSPHGLFVAAVRGGRELVALDPKGNVRWVKPQQRLVRSPRWSYEGYRIAYFVGSILHVINGDGTGDRTIGPADPRVPPRWLGTTHEVTYTTRDGSARVVDADRPASARTLGHGREARGEPRPGTGSLARIERRGPRSIVTVGGTQVFAGAGRLGGLAWSPDGRWLLVTWPDADQLVFLRVGRRPKLVAYANIARQFGSFPELAGWSR
jgi:hypothetical protein